MDQLVYRRHANVCIRLTSCASKGVKVWRSHGCMYFLLLLYLGKILVLSGFILGTFPHFLVLSGESAGARSRFLIRETCVFFRVVDFCFVLHLRSIGDPDTFSRV